MVYAAPMKYQDAIARVRGIVDRHTLPDFILGYDVRLGDFDGDPALWVVFRAVQTSRYDKVEVDRQVGEMNALHAALMPELLEAFEDRFPYFRYEAVPEPVAANGA